jgi:hypothetical protein
MFVAASDSAATRDDRIPGCRLTTTRGSGARFFGNKVVTEKPASSPQFTLQISASDRRLTSPRQTAIPA